MNRKRVFFEENYLNINLSLLKQDFAAIWLTYQKQILNLYSTYSLLGWCRKAFINKAIGLLLSIKQEEYLFIINYLSYLQDERLGIEVINSINQSTVKFKEMYTQIIEKIILNYSDLGKYLFLKKEITNTRTYLNENKYLREYRELIKIINKLLDKDKQTELYQLICEQIAAEIENSICLFQETNRNLFVQSDAQFIKSLERFIVIEDLPYPWQILLITKVNALISKIIEAIDNCEELPTFKGRTIFMFHKAMTKDTAFSVSITLRQFFEYIEDKPADYFCELEKLLKELRVFIKE